MTEKLILIQECSSTGSKRILEKNYVGLKFHKEKRNKQTNTNILVILMVLILV